MNLVEDKKGILKNCSSFLEGTTMYGAILINIVFALIYIGDCILSLKEKK